MGLRRKSREIALQFLFGHDFQGLAFDPESVESAIERFCSCFETSDNAMDYARLLINGVSVHIGEIDQRIKDHSHHWRLERISLVDRNILRIAIYELLYGEDVPSKVAINEALEIAKLYSMPDSVPFVNGVLDGIKVPPGK